MSERASFFNLYRHNFVRLAVAVPPARVADPQFNAEQTISLMKQAEERKALLVVFPELGLSAYSCEDLFQQQALLDASAEGLGRIIEVSRDLSLLSIVGLPLVVDNMLFNCAAVVHKGRLLGLAPKTYLPNYREFYEARQFTSASLRLRDTIHFAAHQNVPFSNRLLFQAEDQPLFTFFVEVCEDLWVPLPPSSYAALRGATVLVNLSASNATIGKDDFRRLLAASQSGRCIAAYVYCAAGSGESTTDLAWDGQGVIYENATKVAETERFLYHPQLITADIDLDRLVQDRMRQNSFAESGRNHREDLADFQSIPFHLDPPVSIRLPLERTHERFPYVPSGLAHRRTLPRSVRDSSARFGETPRSHPFEKSGHRSFRRTRLHTGPGRLRPCHGRAGISSQQYPGLHHARICYDRAHFATGPPSHGRDWLRTPGDRHSAQLLTNVEGYRPPVCLRATRIRHDL